MIEEKGKQPWTLREFGGKTLWDWLQLLIVRGALSLITVAFARQQNTRQERFENQRQDVRARTQGQRGPRGGWEEWQPFVTSVGANFGETRLADIQLPNILRHQDLCTSSSASLAAA